MIYCNFEQLLIKNNTA